MLVRAIHEMTRPIGVSTAAWIAHFDQGYFHANINQPTHRSSLFGHLASRPEWVCSRSPNHVLLHS